MASVLKRWRRVQMLEIPQELEIWGLAFLPLCVSVFTYRKGVLFLIAIFLSSIVDPIINFGGNTSLYYISFTCLHLVAFPSTFLQILLNSYFFIHSLSLPPSFPQRVQHSSVLTQLFTLLGQSQLHYSWKYLALWLHLCIAYSRTCPKTLLPRYIWHTKSKPVQQLHGTLLEEILRIAVLWLVQGDRQNRMQLRDWEKMIFPSLLPHRKPTIFISSSLPKVLVSFDFSYSPLPLWDSPTEACQYSSSSLNVTWKWILLLKNVFYMKIQLKWYCWERFVKH